jgi:hypothetical protein
MWLLRLGRRLIAPPAADVRAQDHRRLVLYLRSFRDDTTGARTPTAPFGPPPSLATEEEQIERALHAFGPVVALGSPTESLPQSGVARLYAANWHEAILDLMATAQLVVFRMGDTEGLWWEIAQAAIHADPTRVLLLIPANQSVYDEFRQRAGERLQWRLPAYTCRRAPYGSLSGFVLFEAGWAPRCVRFELPWRRRGGSDLMTSMLTMSLGPVYRQCGVTWSPPPTSLFGPVMLAVQPAAFVMAALGFLKLLGPDEWQPSGDLVWHLDIVVVVCLGLSLIATVGYIYAFGRAIRDSLIH